MFSDYIRFSWYCFHNISLSYVIYNQFLLFYFTIFTLLVLFRVTTIVQFKIFQEYLRSHLPIFFATFWEAWLLIRYQKILYVIVSCEFPLYISLYNYNYETIVKFSKQPIMFLIFFIWSIFLLFDQYFLNMFWNYSLILKQQLFLSKHCRSSYAFISSICNNENKNVLYIFSYILCIENQNKSVQDVFLKVGSYIWKQYCEANFCNKLAVTQLQ